MSNPHLVQAVRALDKTSALLVIFQRLCLQSQWFNIMLLRMVCITKEPGKTWMFLSTRLAGLRFSYVGFLLGCFCSRQDRFETLLKFYSKSAHVTHVDIDSLDLKKLTKSIKKMIQLHGQSRAYRPATTVEFWWVLWNYHLSTLACICTVLCKRL